MSSRPASSAVAPAAAAAPSDGGYIPGSNVVQGQGPLKDFIFTEKLGSGTYATVYKAFRKSPRRETVAIKVIDKKTLNRPATENLLTEIEILKTMKHDHIVQLRDFVWDDHYIYLVMEFCSGGDLSRFIKKKRVLPEFVAKYCLQQIASALQFLRENNISHLDLKPQNILLDSKDSPILKLADFGFAQHLEDRAGKKGMRGSPLYMAPEILLQNRYDASVDLWSVGVILYESLFGRAPFASESYQQLAEKIKKTKPIEMPANVRLSDGCRDLLSRLLQRDPNERITFEEFFNHPWIDLEHMPSEHCMEKGIQLVKEAVEKDEERDVKEAVRLYCQALEYLVPATYYEKDVTKKEAIRKKTRQYMERAEALKAVLSQIKSLGNSETTHSQATSQSPSHDKNSTGSCSGSSKDSSSATPQTDDTSASSGAGQSLSNSAGVTTVAGVTAVAGVGALSLGTHMKVDFSVKPADETDAVSQLLNELGKMTISSQNTKLQAALTVIQAAKEKASSQDFQAALAKYELALGALIPLLQREDKEQKKAILRKLVSHWMAEAEEIKEVIQVTTVHQKVEAEQEEEEKMTSATQDLCLIQ